MTNLDLLLLIPALPLVAAILGYAAGRKAVVTSTTLSVLASVGAVAIGVYLAMVTQNPIAAHIEWIQLGNTRLNLGVLYTPLASLMTVVVGIVSLAVHIFSIRYMRHDEARTRYFPALSLFTFSMYGLVLVDNLISLFVFWELVGFSSYLLIGHYGTVAAGQAAKKAFLVNRLGDVGLLLGILWALYAYGTTDLLALKQLCGLPIPSIWATMIALLLFMGVAAKSAQWPFHIWLPDAMAGPTPVSALIHAATMVAAGVYLLCRFDFMFVAIQPVILVIGATTAFLAAIWAFGQTDIKRVLAYSTLSQLGFMVVGVGLGSPAAAFFHLTTHAFFKAMLFLGAGAIIDACHHEQDATRMGGLMKKLPFTFAIFVIGSLALAGFPYTAGFFSKDTILGLAQEHSIGLLVVLMITSLLTALYMGRLIGYVFLGQARGEGAQHAKEAGLTYQAPLVLLAVGSLAAGTITLYPSFAAQALALLPKLHESPFFFAWGIIVVAVGAVVAVVYGRVKREPLEGLLGETYNDIKVGFYFDKIWETFGTAVVTPISQMMLLVDEVIVSGALTKGLASGVGLVGIFARWTYKGLLTYALYWILLGALIMVLLANS